ncbi:MAG: hypothetical protein L0H93_22615, partial [Nocardioides sp.]|nr:hypothetical protein [Nocardioides sp.]
MTVEHTCDTSVLVPALISWHPEHEQCRHVVAGVDRLPAHVLLETYSVLTRLPAPHRIDAADAAEAIAGLEFAAVTLPGRVHRDLVVSLAGQRIRGGA